LYRVIDLDGFPGIENVNVVGTSRSFSDRVLCQAEDGVKVLVEALTNGSVKGTKDSDVEKTTN
jgi:hypothetical protein